MGFRHRAAVVLCLCAELAGCSQQEAQPSARTAPPTQAQPEVTPAPAEPPSGVQASPPSPTAALQAALGAAVAALAASVPRSTQPAVGSALPPDEAKWRALLALLPEVRAYAADFVLFTGKDADAALRRAQRSRASITAWTFADGPFAWSPTPGRELWIVAGRSGEQSLTIILERTQDAVRHAASTVLVEKDAPIALGYSAAAPGELLWTTCYGCPGEGGSIRLGDDGRPLFVYR